jgi:TfoX/Sxy family transcriptional regulator of competence genes
MSEEQIDRMDRAVQNALGNVRPEVNYKARKMFGGMGYYANNVMFAAWFGRGLALKLDEADREDLLRVEGAEPAESRQYVEVPDSFLDDPSKLEPWLEKSLAFVESVPHEKNKHKK